MKFSRIAYFGFLTLGTFLSILAMTSFGDTLKGWTWLDAYKNSASAYEAGAQTAYRMSFTLVVLHGIIMLGSLFVDTKHGATFGTAIHRRFFFVKVIVVVAVFILSYFLSNDFFDSYASFSLSVSVIFNYFQFIIIMVYAYRIHIDSLESLMEAAFFKWAIPILSLAVWAGSIFYHVYAIMNWRDGEYVMLVAIICIVLLLGAGVLTFLMDISAPFPLAVLSGLTMTLAPYGAAARIIVATKPVGFDMGVLPGQTFHKVYAWIGGVLLIFTLLQGCVSDISIDPLFQGCDMDVSDLGDYESDDGDEAEYIVWLFHFVMALGAMMMPSAVGATFFTHANREFWTRSLAGVIVPLLYCWTLVAPKLFPDRAW